MPLEKKQQIRAVRILLTVFYGFLLSSTLFRYIIHGIVQTIRRPTNPYAITMIVLGVIILISIGFAVYATWFDKPTIITVSGVVLICVFVLTLVFGVLRIVNTAPQHVILATTMTNVAQFADDSSDAAKEKLPNKATSTSNNYALAEDVTKLIIELVFILFAILATFILQRYVKAKIYAPLATTEKK